MSTASDISEPPKSGCKSNLLQETFSFREMEVYFLFCMAHVVYMEQLNIVPAKMGIIRFSEWLIYLISIQTLLVLLNF
jgi:hypothetical protein